jgi:hypothetical protein
MRTLLLFAIASSLVACGSPSKDAPIVKPVTTTEVAPPDAAPPIDATLDPAVALQQRVDAAIARIPTIKAGLSALRDLPFKDEVPAEYQTTADFRSFVGAEVDTELTGEKAQTMATAFHHIGLLAEIVDLSQTIEDAMVSQAAAYYDPAQKKFFIVMVPKDDMGLDTIAAHELTHALQDQYFGLDAYMAPKPELDDDQAMARKFVVEGEATLTMFAYMAEEMGGAAFGGKHVLDPSILPVIKPGFQQAASLTLDDFKAMTKQQAAGAVAIDDDIQKSIDAMDTIPLLILVPMMDSYMKGMLAVLDAYQAGGWAEVGDLYAHPPDSTEQVLHPDTAMYPKRDVPRHVTLPALKGYTELYGNVMGELDWRVYFMLWNKDVAESAAAGWDGDRWSVLTGKDGATVGVSVSTWDSKAEAAEFAAAYEKTIAVRFPDKSRQIWVKTKGSNVYIVDGGSDAKLIDKLIKGAKVK